jgi:hypothetical protein
MLKNQAECKIFIGTEPRKDMEKRF